MSKAVGTGVAGAARVAPLFAADFLNLLGASYMTCELPWALTGLYAVHNNYANVDEVLTRAGFRVCMDTPESARQRCQCEILLNPQNIFASVVIEVQSNKARI